MLNALALHFMGSSYTHTVCEPRPRRASPTSTRRPRGRRRGSTSRARAAAGLAGARLDGDAARVPAGLFGLLPVGDPGSLRSPASAACARRGASSSGRTSTRCRRAKGLDRPPARRLCRPAMLVRVDAAFGHRRLPGIAAVYAVGWLARCCSCRCRSGLLARGAASRRSGRCARRSRRWPLRALLGGVLAMKWAFEYYGVVRPLASRSWPLGGRLPFWERAHGRPPQYVWSPTTRPAARFATGLPAAAPRDALLHPAAARAGRHARLLHGRPHRRLRAARRQRIGALNSWAHVVSDFLRRRSSLWQAPPRSEARSRAARGERRRQRARARNGLLPRRDEQGVVRLRRRVERLVQPAPARPALQRGADDLSSTCSTPRTAFFGAAAATWCSRRWSSPVFVSVGDRSMLSPLTTLRCCCRCCCSARSPPVRAVGAAS